MALVAGLSLHHAARAQFSRDPFPGTQPGKLAGGADTTWNGVRMQVPPGGEILWTITLVNDAVDRGTDTWIVDDLPDPSDGLPMLPFDPATDVIERPLDGTLDWDGDSLHLDGFFLALGETAVLTVRSRVGPDAEPGTLVCNQAWVTYVESEETGPIGGIPGRWTSKTIDETGEPEPTCVVVAEGPLLAGSTKSATDGDGDGVVEPGEAVTFEIRVRNDGDSPATDVVVSDELPAGLRPVSTTPPARVEGSLVTWDSDTTASLASLPPGEERLLVLEAAADCPVDGGATCNQAFIEAAELDFAVPTGDPALAEPSRATCLPGARPTLSGSPLTVADASGDGVFLAGERTRWTLTVTNAGSAEAADVEVRLPVPDCLSDAVVEDGGLLVGNVATWTAATRPELASMAPGATVGLSMSADVALDVEDGATCSAAAELLAHPACGSETSDDPATVAPDDATSFAARIPPQLELTLSAFGPSADAEAALGETLELRLVLRSEGGAEATAPEVAVDLPAGLLLDLAADGGSVSGDALTWSAPGVPELAVLRPGDEVVLTGRGRLGCLAADGGTSCASGRVTAPELAAPVPSDDPATAAAGDPTCWTERAPVLAGSLLEAADAGGDGAFERGERVTLEVRLSNTGSAAARDVVVELPLLPADVEPDASDGGSVEADRITWDAGGTPELGVLEPGAEVVLRAGVRIDPTAAGRQCHQASIATAGLEPCGIELTDDPGVSGDDVPTCWDVVGTDAVPGEVPDGDPTSGGPEAVRLRCEGPDLLLSWTAAPGATEHAVYRGRIASFRTRPWLNPSAPIDDPEDARDSCGLDLDHRDVEGCATGGEDHYFLVAGRNAVGEGTIGEMRVGGVLEPRPAPTTSCP